MEEKKYCRCANCQYVYDTNYDKCPKCGNDTLINEKHTENTNGAFNICD